MNKVITIIIWLTLSGKFPATMLEVFLVLPQLVLFFFLGIFNTYILVCFKISWKNLKGVKKKLYEFDSFLIFNNVRMEGDVWAKAL